MNDAPETSAETSPSKGIVRDYFETIVTCVIFVLFARTYVFQQSKIPTGSMIPTLLIGDYIMVNKHVYAPTSFEWEKKLLPIRDVRRHDIIVFKYPEEPEKDYIKRIIGLPGDVVEVRHQRLFLNGVPQNEPFVQHIYPGEAYRDADDYPPTKVPPDHYFAMGDNRDNSRDSRFWGMLPRDQVKGRAFLVYWSYEASRDEYHRTGYLDWLRDTATAFGKTRWKRFFHLIR